MRMRWALGLVAAWRSRRCSSAGTMSVDGDFHSGDVSEDVRRVRLIFLSAHNRELLNDGKENIVDDYCALMAATELYRASHAREALRTAADQRADHLMVRLMTEGKYRDYWRADDVSWPFFHPSDAGLPVVSLLEYAQVASRGRAEAGA